MTNRIVVIIRGKVAYVAPQEGNGVRWVVEPVLVVATERDALAGAIRSALGEASRRQPLSGGAVDLRSYTSPILRASGLKRQSVLDRGAKRFEVSVDGADARIERWIPDRKNRGYTRDDGWSKSFPAAAVDRISEFILDAARTTPSR